MERSSSFSINHNPPASEVLDSDDDLWYADERRQKRQNDELSMQKLSAVLGADRQDGGALGDLLRRSGDSPEEILGNLNLNEKLQEEVWLILRRRVGQLYKLQYQNSQPIFKEGVDEARTKDIPSASSVSGQMTGLNSLDYVALVALDMISGRFDIGQSNKNPIDEYDGHHRDAAEKVLASFASAPIDNNKPG